MNADAYAQIGREAAALRWDLHGLVPDPNNRELHDAIDFRLYEIMQFCHSLRMPDVSRRPAKVQRPAPPEEDPPPAEPPPEAAPAEAEPTPVEPEPTPVEPVPTAPTLPPTDVPKPPTVYAALAPETIKMQRWREQMKLLEPTPAAYNRHVELGKTLLASLDDANKLLLLNELLNQGKTHNLGCKGWVFYQLPNTTSEPYPY